MLDSSDSVRLVINILFFLLFLRCVSILGEFLETFDVLYINIHLSLLTIILTRRTLNDVIHDDRQV
jgi:uncharacterized membrane protein